MAAVSGAVAAMYAMTVRRPKFVNSWPEWWHPHGMKIALRSASTPGNLSVIMGSNVAELVVSYLNGWFVGYKLNHVIGGTACASLMIGAETLKAMFGIDGREHVDLGDELMIRLYGGSSASRGRFLRFERWLNIPGPGSGGDGDPNLSVEVTPEIRAAIVELMKNAAQAK